jgi:hypothetical protein
VTEAIPIEPQSLIDAGVPPTVGTRFFALANLIAMAPEEVRPSDFEPIPQGYLDSLTPL